MSQSEAHWVRKPFEVGDEVTALCGLTFAVSEVRPNLVECAECVRLHPSRMRVYTLVIDTRSVRRTPFAISA